MAALPQFITEDFGAFLEHGVLAHVCLRLRCGVCVHGSLLAPRMREPWRAFTLLHAISSTLVGPLQHGTLVFSSGKSAVVSEASRRAISSVSSRNFLMEYRPRGAGRLCGAPASLNIARVSVR